MNLLEGCHVNDQLRRVFRNFSVYGDYLSASPYGNGHINDTYEVRCRQAGQAVRYIVQRINNHVFRDPPGLMDNIHRICNETARRLEDEGVEEPSRRGLTTVLTRTGLPYHLDDEGNYWRMYFFIEGAIGYEVVENARQAYEAAFAFGTFQRLLAELPGGRLNETIEGFHDTPRRFRRFVDAVETDAVGRAASARREIEFFQSYENDVSLLIDLNRSGVLPERVTHNDTKLNNVLIDTTTHRAVCVIDLDTSMPGLAPYDFGDLIRTSAVRTAEDEEDVERVAIDFELFDAAATGYLAAADFLERAERDHLVFGAKLLTYEVGLRFLTDYLEGDRYFKTRRTDHNLIRCRTQRKLVESIETHRDTLEETIARFDRPRR